MTLFFYARLHDYLFCFRCFTARLTKSEVYAPVQVQNFSQEMSSSSDEDEALSLFRTHDFDKPPLKPKAVRKRLVELSDDRCSRREPSVRQIGGFKFAESNVPPLERMKLKI